MNIVYKYMLIISVIVISVVILTKYSKTYNEILKQTFNLTKHNFEYENNAKIDEEPVIILAGAVEPYIFFDKENEGFVGEIIKEIFKVINRKYEIKQVQFIRSQISVEEGKVWGTALYAYTQERAKDFLFSDPIIKADTKFFYYNKPSNRDYNYDTLNELTGYAVGSIPGLYYDDKLRDAILNIHWYNDPRAIVDDLKNGVIQLGVLDQVNGWHIINKYYPDEVDKFGVVEKPLSTDIEAGHRIMVSKKYPNSEKILEDFNKGLKIIKEDGTLEKILKKYPEDTKYLHD